MVVVVLNILEVVLHIQSFEFFCGHLCLFLVVLCFIVTLSVFVVICSETLRNRIVDYDLN